MAQIDKTLYKTIADAYALIDDALSGVSANARTAVDAIVDVTTTGYPDPSAHPDSALEIELALLQDFNAAYVTAQNLAASTTSLLDAVRTINNFVITESSGTGTAATKLNTWINDEMNPEWTNHTVPTGWKNLCTDAGYTTTTWV